MDGDEHIYCDAIERRMMESESLPGISEIITAKFGKSLDALRNMSMVNSRHAAIIYWEGAVCVLRRSGQFYDIWTGSINLLPAARVELERALLITRSR